jgi:hypothetical protein
MSGDERSRFCAKCRLHVHDLSAMTRDEAVEFLGRPGGAATCVRFARRPDGRFVTRDCRVAVRALRRRAFLAAAALAGALGLGGAALALAHRAGDAGGPSSPEFWETEPFATIARMLPASWIPQRQIVVGKLLMVPSPPAPTPFVVPIPVPDLEPSAEDPSRER